MGTTRISKIREAVVFEKSVVWTFTEQSRTMEGRYTCPPHDDTCGANQNDRETALRLVSRAKHSTSPAICGFRQFNKRNVAVGEAD